MLYSTFQDTRWCFLARAGGTCTHGSESDTAQFATVCVCLCQAGKTRDQWFRHPSWHWGRSVRQGATTSAVVPSRRVQGSWSLAPPAALQLHAARQWHNASSPPVFSISLTCLCLWFCQSRLQVMEHQFNHYLQFIVTVSAQNVLENELELVFCL